MEKVLKMIAKTCLGDIPFIVTFVDEKTVHIKPEIKYSAYLECGAKEGE